MKEKFEEIFSDIKSSNRKIAKSFGKLFALLGAEPFLDPYFKSEQYRWENEWRIVKPYSDLEYDSIKNRSYIQLDPRDIKHVWFSSQMDSKHYEKYRTMCEDNGIRYSLYSYGNDTDTAT